MEFSFVAEGLFSLEDIRRVRDRAKNSFSIFGDFVDFSPISRQFGEIHVKGQLPTLSESKGLLFDDFFIIGYLPIKENSFDMLFKVLDKCQEDIGYLADFTVQIGFEENTSIQTKKDYDAVGVGIRKGRRYFIYSPAGSNVVKDLSYRKQFLSQMIITANLPLDIVEKEEGFYILHRQGGDLFTSLGGGHDENPAAFTCELSLEPSRGLMEHLKLFLEKHATGKRFEYSWVVSTEGADFETSNHIYKLLIEKDIPSIRCQISFSYSLIEIQAIGGIRALCGPKDEFRTFLCSFDLPETNWGEIHVITKAKGHQLELTLWRTDDLEEVGKKLGLKFKAAY